MRHLIAFISLLAVASLTLCNAQPSSQTQQKTIKDPAEYNAYIAALNTADPVAKAASMEAFVNQYPNSIVKIDALEQAMAAYQQSNNPAKLRDIADRILQLDPDNIRALAIATFLKRVDATNGNAQAVREIAANAERGLKALPSWTKPEGTTDADFKLLVDQMAKIFYGAAGFAALQSKDYSHARDYYLKSIRIDPGDLQDTYQLSIADLEMNPIDVDGLWYIAKAINLAKGNQPAQESIAKYGKAKYKRYHGGEDSWDQIVTSAAASATLPSGFSATMKPAPTPAEIAVIAVKENDPGTLSFSDWEYVLSYRDASADNKQAADRVWQAIQITQKNGDVKLSMEVKVISVTSNTIDVAITDDNQQANQADLHVILEKPIATPPVTGARIKVIGVLTSYTPRPFMFVMQKASIGQ